MSDATDRGRALTDLLAEAEGADEVRQAEIADLLRAEAGLADLTGEDALRAARLIHRSGVATDLPVAGRLAKRAHDDGVAGAGRLFAECADMISLYSGRPQPFGTVSIEHMGDIVLPPVDRNVYRLRPRRARRGAARHAAARRRRRRRAGSPASGPASPARCRGGSGGAGCGPIPTRPTSGPAWRPKGRRRGPTATS